MPGFNTLPAVGGGGGQANMTFVAAVHMETYNRSWAQGGTPGYYAMYSTNQENGYVYFVGATTTGGPLNRLINVTHSFTRIDVIAPQNDMLSLYKAKVKSTTVFNNPFAAFASFPSIISSSGNFVLPNNALPLVNIVLSGGGGGGGGSYHNSPSAGGGGGGSVVKLTAYQAVGTTAITIGSGGSGGGGDNSHGENGGKTYFGNVYALGGGGGLRRDNAGYNASWVSSNPGIIGNGGGAGAHHANSGAPGFTQTSSTGLGLSGAPVGHGGFTGGNCTHNSTGSHNRAGGGAGAMENGGDGSHASGGDGGLGHSTDLTGTANSIFGAGGRADNHYGGHGTNGWDRVSHGAVHSHGGHSGRNGSGSGGANGTVVVRYYIP
jgi:hypothetical protein